MATGCCIDDLNFKLPPGGIVGVIGPNGAGKTTLFRMLTGQEKPDAGGIEDRRNRAARLCRPVARQRSIRNKNVWQEISGGTDIIESRQDARSIRAPIARAFNFKGGDQQKKVGHAVGRRAQPRPSGQDAEIGRQCPAARRTDQRSRRRHPARPGRRRWRISPAAP